MSALFRRESPLDKHIKRIEKEISLVDKDIRYLSKVLEKPGSKEADLSLLKSVDRTRPQPRQPPVQIPKKHVDTERPVDSIAGHENQAAGFDAHGKEHDERFADYLATNFSDVPPLRYEKNVQRNKAIMAVIALLLVLFLLLYNFLL